MNPEKEILQMSTPKNSEDTDFIAPLSCKTAKFH